MFLLLYNTVLSIFNENIFKSNSRNKLTLCKFEIWDMLYKKFKVQYNECFEMYVHVALSDFIPQFYYTNNTIIQILQ